MSDTVKKIQDLLEKLKSVEFEDRGTGWKNIAPLGKLLKDNGICFTGKLQSYLSKFENSFEFHEDFSNPVKVVYVRAIQKNNDKAKREMNKYRLMDWAYLRDINDFLSQLAEMAIAERWSFPNGLPLYPKNAILWSYIKYTFCRLQYQNKVIFSINGDYAAFNTGLVDNRYMSIIALFKRNKREEAQSEWIFSSFVISGEGKGKILNNYFVGSAEPATYTDNAQDLIYDITLGTPLVDYDHIIVEHVERLPEELISTVAPQFPKKNTDEMTKDELNEYYSSLRIFIMNNPSVYRSILNRFSSAIDLALKKVRWNYKNAVPMFYPKENRMCLLLPLCLVDDEHEDIALVVKKTPANKYEGATMLPMDWAYVDARVVAKPNSEWLDAENIAGSIEA